MNDSESPTPQDVLAHVYAHPVEGGADPLDHFLSTITAMPPEEFHGNTFLAPVGDEWEGDGISFETRAKRFVYQHEGLDPRVAHAHAQRCFIGHAVVVAPEIYTDEEKASYSWLGEVAFVARVYHLPEYLVGYIYTGVMQLRFDDAVQFVREVIAAERKRQVYPFPSHWTGDDSNDRSLERWVDLRSQVTQGAPA